MGFYGLGRRDLVLVLVLAIVATAVGIKLTGEHVCQKMENYTISMKESYMEPVVINTFAWCFQVPPRCPNSRVEMRQKWRIKTETRQKRISECCEGYELSNNDETARPASENLENYVSRCIPRCDVCEHGDCVDANTCQCQPGYRGNGCTHECTQGTWGVNCAQECNCRSVEMCNPVDGKCHCPSGWRGPGCTEKCPPGLWGIDCASVCTCIKDSEKADSISFIKQEQFSVCHHETGSCMDFPTVKTTKSDTPSSEYSSSDENMETITDRTPPLTKFDQNMETITDRTPPLTKFDQNMETITDRTPPSTKFDQNMETITDRTPPSTKFETLEHAQVFDADNPSYTDGGSAYRIHDEISEKLDLSTIPTHEYDRTSLSSTVSEKNSEQSANGITSETGKTETIATIIGTNEYDNYKIEQRVESIETRVSRIKKPSTPGPIVAVLHVSGNGSPDHDAPMIVTSVSGEKITTRAVTMPIGIAAMIVIGSIVSLGLTTLAVLALLHVCSKLLETIRLSIYDTEKSDISTDTIRRPVTEKGNSARISSTASNNPILACEYETPRCMILEHQTLTRSRPESSLTLTKKVEANYSNDYSNVRMCDNLQELLQAHYDRPPSTFRPTILDVEGEHVYDEIPLQSSTTFATSKRDS